MKIRKNQDFYGWTLTSDNFQIGIALLNMSLSQP